MRLPGGMIARRRILTGSAAFASLAWLPERTFAQAAPRQGGVLRWAVPDAGGPLDPMNGNSVALPALYETLTGEDGLADSWQLVDPLTLIMDLLPGIKFHDGTDFASDSVKLNLERYRADPRVGFAPPLAALDDLLVVGRHRLEFHLRQPDPLLTSTLATRAGRIAAPFSFGKPVPIGTGPFRFDGRTDTSLHLVRYTDYRRPGLPRLEGIDLATTADPAAALALVIAGRADLASALPAELGPAVDQAGPALISQTDPDGRITVHTPRLRELSPDLSHAWLER